MRLMILGLGYTAGRYLQLRGARFTATATVTSAERARLLSRPGLDALVFSPEARDPRVAEAVRASELALVSIPPDASGDPTLAAFGEDFARAPDLRALVYLSTVGVYGDHGGAWVDETTPCRPVNARGAWRLAAEAAWRDFGARAGKPVHVLRLAGIYGPGQNALTQVRNGTARRIVKPGQVFNRIHVDDIGAAIDACFAHRGEGGIWNVSDDEPAPAQDVVSFAAELLGVEPPLLVPFDQANLSPMARSFYAECKRVRNDALKRDLGASLAYPNYRDGLRSLLIAPDGGNGGPAAA